MTARGSIQCRELHAKQDKRQRAHVQKSSECRERGYNAKTYHAEGTPSSQISLSISPLRTWTEIEVFWSGGSRLHSSPAFHPTPLATNAHDYRSCISDGHFTAFHHSARSLDSRRAAPPLDRIQHRLNMNTLVHLASDLPPSQHRLRHPIPRPFAATSLSSGSLPNVSLIRAGNVPAPGPSNRCLGGASEPMGVAGLWVTSGNGG